MMRRSTARPNPGSVGTSAAQSLRSDFLTRIAKWASAVVPPLGALFGHRLAERSGAQIKGQLQCQRCETIIASSDEFLAAKKAGSKVCSYCGHLNKLKKAKRVAAGSAAATPTTSSAKKKRKRKSWPMLKDVAASQEKPSPPQKVAASEKVAAKNKKSRMMLPEAATPGSESEKRSNGGASVVEYRVVVTDQETSGGGGSSGEADFKLSALRKVVQFDSEAQESMADSGNNAAEEDSAEKEKDAESVENAEEVAKVSAAELVHVDMEVEPTMAAAAANGEKVADANGENLVAANGEKMADVGEESNPSVQAVETAALSKSDAEMEEGEIPPDDELVVAPPVPPPAEAKDLELNPELVPEVAALEELSSQTVEAQEPVSCTQDLEKTAAASASESAPSDTPKELSAGTSPTRELAEDTHAPEEVLPKTSEESEELAPIAEESAPNSQSRSSEVLVSDDLPVSEKMDDTHQEEKDLELHADEEETLPTSEDQTSEDQMMETVQKADDPPTSDDPSTFAEPAKELDAVENLTQDDANELEAEFHTAMDAEFPAAEYNSPEDFPGSSQGRDVAEKAKRGLIKPRRDPSETLKRIVRSFSRARTVRTACHDAYMSVVKRQCKVLLARCNGETSRAASEKKRADDLSLALKLYKSTKKLQKSQAGQLSRRVSEAADLKNSLQGMKAEMKMVHGEVTTLSTTLKHLIATMDCLRTEIAAAEAAHHDREAKAKAKAIQETEGDGNNKTTTTTTAPQRSDAIGNAELQSTIVTDGADQRDEQDDEQDDDQDDDLPMKLGSDDENNDVEEEEETTTMTNLEVDDDKSSKMLGICGRSKQIRKRRGMMIRSPRLRVKGGITLTKIGRRWKIGP